MVNSLLITNDNNDKTTILNGQTLQIHDSGGPGIPYLHNQTHGIQLSFTTKYHLVIDLDSEKNYDYLGIFNGTYKSLALNNGIPQKFTSNGIAVPVEVILHLESGQKQFVITVEASTTLTVGFAADANTGGEGFSIRATPYVDEVIRDFSFDKSNIVADFLKNREFQGCSFREIYFKANDLTGAVFKSCDFSNSDIDGITIDQNTFFDATCTFTGVRAQNIIGTTDNLPSGISLKEGHLFGRGLSQKGKVFGAMDLTGINFVDNDWAGADLSLATLGNNPSGGIKEGSLYTFLQEMNTTDSPTRFGVAVALSSDGSVLAVGDDYFTNSRGKVKVFQLVNGVYVQKGEDLIPDSPTDSDLFGASVSLNNDGTIVAVGALENVTGKKGYVIIYKYQDNMWQPIGQRIEGENSLDWNGYSVSLSNDGIRVAIGAVFDDTVANTNTNTGRIRVFELQNNVWIQVGGDIDGVIEGGNFGHYVALSADGKTLLGNTKYAVDDMAVYQEVNGQWSLKGSRITGLGEQRSSISGDGDTIIVDDDNTFSVKVLEYNGSEWIPKGETIYGDPIPTGASYIYNSKISEDGNKFIFTASDFKVYSYEWIDNKWTLIAEPVRFTKMTYDRHNLDFSGDGKIFALGNYQEHKVDTYLLRSTLLPTGWRLSDGYLIKFVEEVNGGVVTLTSAPELADPLLRNEYLLGVKALLPEGVKINVLTSAFGESFLPAENTITEVAFANDTVKYSLENNFYVVLKLNESMTIENSNSTISLKVTEKVVHKLLSYDAIKKKLLPGKDKIIKDFIHVKSGSLFAYYLPEDIICFHGSELVETDQGLCPIQEIDTESHTIRQQPIQKLSRTRCKEAKMVSIRKNSLGDNIPNKDTLVSMNHQILYNDKMVPARLLTRKHGVTFVESNNQVVYNVMLPSYTHMKVNNMIVETLHPKNE